MTEIKNGIVGIRAKASSSFKFAGTGFVVHGGLIVTALLVCIASACAAPPDTSLPNTAALNGSAYGLGLRETPIAYIQEIEAGFSTDSLGTLLYPLSLPTSLPQPGLQITFYPARVAVGQDITFGLDNPDSGISLEYYPLFNPRVNEGLILAYSLRGGGGGQIRFEALDMRIGGQVKGALNHATLYGYYERIDSGEVVEEDEPAKLELWNFAFDVTLQDFP
jgi:hypothetical protein